LFDELSTTINGIPELCSLEPIAELEPDPAIEAFAKSARTKKKLLMQDEVNQPAGYLNYETAFRPQSALIPCWPWLAPHLSIILPPSNIVHAAIVARFMYYMWPVSR